MEEPPGRGAVGALGAGDPGGLGDAVGGFGGASAPGAGGCDAVEGENRIPVTVLAGAFGAGKTTLLKHVLEKPHGYRIAVIQNEFSEEMGIEGPLITDARGETFKDIVELPNGCLCCSAKDGLISALDRLLEDRRRFDYVLVEATGMADPEAICDIFWVDDQLGSRVFLDGVVVLVDGRHARACLAPGRAEAEEGAGGEGAGADHRGAATLGLEAEVAKQIACADVLVLNKTDLTSEAARADLRARLRAMNPTAGLLESLYSAVPLASILGIRAFDQARLAASLAELRLPAPGRGGAPGGAPGGGSHGHSKAHGEHYGYGGEGQDAGCGECQRLGGGSGRLAEHGVESLLLRAPPGGPRGGGSATAACLDPRKVRSWMADVLWEETAGGVYRCKGLFRGPSERALAHGGGVEGEEQLEAVAYGLQGVGKLFEIEAVPRVVVAESKFLFIGRSLRRDVLQDGLRRCGWSPTAGGAGAGGQ